MSDFVAVILFAVVVAAIFFGTNERLRSWVRDKVKEWRDG